MRLNVIETNFVSVHNWMFKLADESGQEYYLMDSNFYESNYLSDPVSRRELDGLDKGHWINAVFEVVNGINVVTVIN